MFKKVAGLTEATPIVRNRGEHSAGHLSFLVLFGRLATSFGRLITEHRLASGEGAPPRPRRLRTLGWR